MSEKSNTDNSKLFFEAMLLSEKLKYELHCKARNKSNNVFFIRENKKSEAQAYNKHKQQV